MFPWVVLGLVLYGIYKSPNRQQIVSGIIESDKLLLQNAAEEIQRMATTPSTQQAGVVAALPDATGAPTSTVVPLSGFGIDREYAEVVNSPFTRRNYAL